MRRVWGGVAPRNAAAMLKIEPTRSTPATAVRPERRPSARVSASSSVGSRLARLTRAGRIDVCACTNCTTAGENVKVTRRSRGTRGELSCGSKGGRVVIVNKALSGC